LLGALVPQTGRLTEKDPEESLGERRGGFGTGVRAGKGIHFLEVSMLVEIGCP